MSFRDLLKRKNITQEQLAKKLKVSQPTISGWLNGVAVPKTRDLSKVAKALGVSVEELLSCFEK